MTVHRRICASLAAFALAASIACSESDTTGPANPGDGDHVPPQPVVDPVLTYPSAGGGAFLAWTAPRDDDDHDTVAEYEIRYSYSSPLVWEYALPVADPPRPAKAGEPQSYEFGDPRRGRDLYAAIRCFDANDNPSEISAVSHVHIDGFGLSGSCVDAMSGAALEGLDVEITDRRVHRLSSDAQGRYDLDDVASGVVNVSVRSGETGTLYHGYERALDLVGDESLDHIMVEFTPTQLPGGKNLMVLLLQATGAIQEEPLLKKWASYPIPVYVPTLVNAHGLDYEADCVWAIDHWNERVGEDVFRLTDAKPATGVWFEFKSREDMTPHLGITHHENDEEGFPLTSDISIVDDFADQVQFRTVALHELGHTIRLNHLPTGYLMFAGQPLPPTVTDDEVMLVRLYLALPNEIDLSVYDPFPLGQNIVTR